MRDRNQTFQNFRIQLEKVISSNFNKIENRKRVKFSHGLSLEFRPYSLHREIVFKYRRNFRTLRLLSIVHWYLPEEFLFLLHLDLEERDLSHLNPKQKLEIKILLQSRNICERYLFLTQRYTGSEIFGNILGNDFQEVFKNFNYRLSSNPIPRKKIYRRGPKDYGTLSDHSISIINQEFRKDVLSLEEEQIFRKEESIHNLSLNYISNYLERIQFSEVETERK